MKPCIFKNKKASVRYVDGKMNMITFFVTFGELPIGSKFRFGYEQDDYTYFKTDNNSAYTRMCKNCKQKFDKKFPVLVDFYMYRRVKDKFISGNR